MARILVTGSSGFIGRHLVVGARAGHHIVIPVDRQDGDIVHRETWDRFSITDVVIHLAGPSFVPDSWVKPAHFLEVNIRGVVQALEYCRRYGAKLVLLSSYLYGKSPILPTPESAPVEASNPYALSKRLAEEISQFYSLNFAIPVTVLRPFNVYGHGQPAEFLIPNILAQLDEGRCIRVKDLHPKRDFVYIDDLIRAILRTLERTQPFDVFNIGSGVSYSVGEIIAKIQNAAGTKLPVESEESSRPGEIVETIADISKAKTELQWSPTIRIESGLKQLLTLRHGS